jgi:WD40 repeat protein
MGQRFESLAALTQAAQLARRQSKPAGDFGEMRNLAIAALALPDIRLEKEWDGWPEGSRRVGFDDRLEHYARSDAKGDVTVRRLADDVEVARLSGNGDTVSCGFGPGGASSLLLHDYSDHSLKLWDFRADTLTRLAQSPGGHAVERWLITGDGQRLVRLDADGALNVFDWPSGRPLHSQPIRFGKWQQPGAAAVGYSYWSVRPSRHQLAIALGPELDPERQVVRVVDLDRGEVITELRRPTGEPASWLAWHLDGKTLAVGYSETIVLWDVPTKKPVRVISEHKGGGLAVCFDRTGEVLLSWSVWAGGVQLRHTQTGQLLLKAPDLKPDGFGPLPDGRLSGLRTDRTRLKLWVIDPARECRTLVRDPARGDVGEYWRHAIHPDGRLAAVGTSTGVTLLDLVTGLDVGHLDLGHNLNVAFDPATGDLLTYGERGLFRWPVQAAADAPGRLRVGPPRNLPVAGRPVSAAVRVSDDGKTVAVAQGDHAVVLHQERPEQPVVLQPLEDVRSHIALSPDGKWVATGRNDGHGGDIRVWDAGDGRLVKAFGIREGMCVRFSPDGRWLVGNDKSAYRFWRVGSWDEGPQARVRTPLFVDWPPAFSPDGRLLALERGDGAVRLIEAASGRELAVLEDPQQGRSGAITFSPDGTLLLLTNKDNNVLRLWDLRKLRAGLRAIDLDWEAPPYPAADGAAPPARPRKPLEVEVVEPDSSPER